MAISFRNWLHESKFGNGVHSAYSMPPFSNKKEAEEAAEKHIGVKQQKENSDATMMMSGKDGYDQNLQEPEGLAYKKPKIPQMRSKLGEKIDKIFGKRKKNEG